MECISFFYNKKYTYNKGYMLLYCLKYFCISSPIRWSDIFAWHSRSCDRTLSAFVFDCFTACTGNYLSQPRRSHLSTELSVRPVIAMTSGEGRTSGTCLNFSQVTRQSPGDNILEPVLYGVALVVCLPDLAEGNPTLGV